MPYKDPKSARAIESARAAGRRWKKAHREEANTATRRWQQTPAGRAANRANAALRRAAPGYWLKRRARQYGCDPLVLLAAQGGRCAICRKDITEKFVIDHSHESGLVRGLLCGPCNLGIGQLGDSAERLFSAALYLEGRT